MVRFSRLGPSDSAVGPVAGLVEFSKTVGPVILRMVEARPSKTVGLGDAAGPCRLAASAATGPIDAARPGEGPTVSAAAGPSKAARSLPL